MLKGLKKLELNDFQIFRFVLDKTVLHVETSECLNTTDEVHFASGCQDVILLQTAGEVQSPSYPNNYPNDVRYVCFILGW